MIGLIIAAWVMGIVLSALTIVALTNYIVDPAKLYRSSRRPVRALRARKLDLLRWRRGKPIRTLILGSSRAYNLDLTEQQAFPAPVFNMAVTAACTEDYLVAYNLVRKNQTEPLEQLVIACEPPALHPYSKLPWEAYISQEYTTELERLGALRRGPMWRWIHLFSITHFRESANEWQRLRRARKLQALHKFQWRSDGYGTWLDHPVRQNNQRLTERQLRNYPRTGLRFNTYERIGTQRAEWLDELLLACHEAGTQVLVYIPPEHPELVALTDKLTSGKVFSMVSQHLISSVAKYKGVFRDWHDPSSLGLTATDFRDAIHPRDNAQALIAEQLTNVLTENTGSREDYQG